MVRPPLALVFALLVSASGAAAQTPAVVAPPPAARAPLELTADGAWCWFSDPRAVRIGDDLYGGWITADGSIQVGRHGLRPAAPTETATLAPRFERDDHDHPALLALPDGRLAAFFAKHCVGDLHFQVTLRPHDISAWSPDRTLGFDDRGTGPRGVTYANPFLLRDEADAIHLFWRGSDFKPTFSVSRDLGATWSAARTLINEQGRDADNRPYVKYWSDGRARIAFAFTDGHPRNEPTNNLYFASYEGGAFHRADGSAIGDVSTLPLQPAQCDRVYDGATGGRAWVWSLAQDSSGAAVIAYTRLPTENDHRYHYARWDGRRWVDHEIASAGKWFPRTPAGTAEREPHYSGGMALDPSNPSVVYLSRPVDGVFEIERWTTGDGGATWSHEPVTRRSVADNVRPFVTADGSALLWMRTDGGYVHYTDYRSRILMVPLR